VIVPERRSVGVTASAWKTSAGAAVRVPVARASNLNNALKQFKGMGMFVLGLDGDGDVSLPDLSLATEPVCIVVGSEGKGLSRLVRENCDQIVSIPIDSAMESLNASMAVGISLYEISRQRATK
jgi:23S rRNA (guanosine2251-2'-O)-methyltransferase